MHTWTKRIRAPRSEFIPDRSRDAESGSCYGIRMLGELRRTSPCGRARVTPKQPSAHFGKRCNQQSQWNRICLFIGSLWFSEIISPIIYLKIFGKVRDQRPIFTWMNEKWNALPLTILAAFAGSSDKWQRSASRWGVHIYPPGRKQRERAVKRSRDFGHIIMDSVKVICFYFSTKCNILRFYIYMFIHFINVYFV